MDNLDSEEKSLSESLHRTGYKSVPGVEKRMKEAVEAASNTRLKDKKITIRISSLDIMGLKHEAANQGIPYQTLITSILHQYTTGQLVNARQLRKILQSDVKE